MDSNRARALFYQHASAMAYIDIETAEGDRSIGSAFHIGEGVFITARHVAINKIIEIKNTGPIPVSSREYFKNILGVNVSEEYIKEYDDTLHKVLGTPPAFKHWEKPLEIDVGPIFHKNEKVDLAVFKVKELHPNVSVVKLGVHWDDWVYRGLWHLSDAIVLGYPPIPMSSSPHLIGAKAEIHTYFTPRHSPHVHFVLSAIPRGGFSGGVALHENGDALGVVTNSLVENSNPPELGFFGVLSIEPIVACLEENGLFPQVQKEHHEHLLSGKKRS